MALQIDALLELQSLDTEIGKLQQEQEALDRGDRVERALAIRQARLTQAERRYQGLQIEQRSAELELKGLEAKKHEESQRLYSGKVTAPRELQSIEMEIAMLERQRQRLDENLLKRMDEIEAARKVVEAATAAVDEAQKALKIVRRRYEKEAARIEGELGKLVPRRKRIAKSLEPEVLQRYDSIRRRQHNIGAVRIENLACGGCRMKVGGALMRRVVAGEQYVYCESCSRFLFPPAEES